MRRSIATLCLSGSLREKLEAIAAAGFDAIELFENDLLQFPGTPAELRRMATDLGLAIDLYQPLRDFEGVEPVQFGRNLDRAERKFDLLQELGAPLLLVCSNVQAAASGELGLVAEQLWQLAERAAPRDLKVGFEALSWGRQINRFAQAFAVVERAAHANLGLILDSFHTLALRDDFAPIAQLPGEKIFFVQLSDAPFDTTPVPLLTRGLRSFPGLGDYDMVGFVAAVLQAGYRGPLSLEIFNDEFRCAPAPAMAQAAMRSLYWLEQQVGQAWPAAPTAIAAPVAELFCAPSQPELQGYAFIGVCVDNLTGPPLAAHLQQLGFTLGGRHRDLPIDLFCQGQVRLLLNYQADAPARDYFAAHGCAVYASAFASPDARAAHAHAAAFEPAAPALTEELAIPSIASPDQGRVYFCDAQQGLAREFAMIDASSAQAVLGGTAQVDHLVQAMPVNHLDIWAGFYRALFDLAQVPAGVSHDPMGVIRNRVLQSPGGTLRHVLKASAHQDTQVARAVAQFAGAGVQRIVIRVDDLLASARQLQELGAPLLAIPDNYYHDLAARYPLEARVLTQLKTAGVLYERQGEGELLHLFTQPLAGRFCFELIERRGGYADYGLADEHVVFAAMSRAQASRLPA